jgi:pyruvate,water dikinase
MGVLVQRMVRASVAGVAFTVNPVSGATDEVVINASWGLGEALVGGRVDPDEYVVAKSSGDMRLSRLGEKGAGDASRAALTPDHVRELTTIVLDIEAHDDAPQDVEWCHDGTRFWIVQARPVTTTVNPSDEVEWTRANLAEVLPDLTSPQALDAFVRLLETAERRNLGPLLAPVEQLGPMVKTFYGRLYFNLSQFRRLCRMVGTPPALMLKSMGHAGAIHPGDEIATRPSIRVLAALPHLVRMVWRHRRAGEIVRRHDAAVRAYLERLRSINPHALSDAELWVEIDRWGKSGPEFMQTVLLLGGVLFHEGPIWKACAQVGFPFERLVYPQLAIGERSVSAQQAFDLVALAHTARSEPQVAAYLLDETVNLADVAQLRRSLARTDFLAAFERFLDEYGHRGRYESDWALPRYHEDPSPLLQSIRMHLLQSTIDDPEKEAARRAREAADAWAAFEAGLTPWQKLTLLPRVRRAVAMVKQYYVWRERVRSDLVRVLSALRRWHLVLADRFVDRGWLDRRDDYFLLLLDEVASTIHGHRSPQTVRAIVAERRAERARVAPLQMPLLMHESQLRSLIRTAGVSEMMGTADDLRGQPVSGGCVEAEVVVVRDPGDFRHMRRGAILVAPATDPSWTPLFTLAAGVIVEVGGVLSHASTIAREYGLPAIANVKHATRRLRTGERVRLDANTGVIQKLESTGDGERPQLADVV